MQCPMCDCCEAAWAAPLGSLWHACCRACGMMYTFTPEESDVGSADTEDSTSGVR